MQDQYGTIVALLDSLGLSQMVAIAIPVIIFSTVMRAVLRLVRSDGYSVSPRVSYSYEDDSDMDEDTGEGIDEEATPKNIYIPLGTCPNCGAPRITIRCPYCGVAS